MKKYNQGFSVLVLIVILVVVLGAGYYYFNKTTISVTNDNTVDITQEGNPITNNNVSSSLKFGKCDWSRVKKVSQISHGKTDLTLNVVGDKLIGEEGTDVSFLKGNFCNTSAISSFESNESAGLVGYNTNGEWFGPVNNGKEAKMKITISEENGEKYIASESRIISPANGGVYIGIVKISITSGFMKSFLSMGVGGSDLMLSKSVEQIGKENPTLYTPIEYVYE